MSGTAVATAATNSVTWSGVIPPGGTITISAAVNVGAAVGSTVSNQATISYDLDGNGTNEASGVSDNPATVPAGDPTSFAVGAADAAVIPALGAAGPGLLSLLVALGRFLHVRCRLS